MRTSIVALLLALAGAAAAAPIPPVGCPNCILNTASPQNAIVNLGTATIRGTLTVSTLSVTNLVVANLTATQFVGGGAGLTNLNASQLASGAVPAARLTGAYTGVTGVGTLAAGTWQGTVVAPQYGGTGQNWAAVGRGALPFFNGTGTMSTLAAGAATRLLQANGAGADPSWTAAPTVLGTNITALPLANLQTGNLPAAIKATDASLVSVSGSKISGDISGDAGGITGTLSLSQLEAGTLPVNIVAQTLNNIGTPVGTFGGPLLSAAVTTDNQGRVTNITQYVIPSVSTRTAWIDQDNNWHGAGQTSLSSWTFVNNVRIEGTLALDNALAVTSGGTGRATLAANALPYGLGSSAVGLLPVLGNGGLVIGTGGVPSTGTITGTANQVVVTNAAGKITLSAPQDLGTGSSPTFAALTLTAPLTTGNGGTGQDWAATAAGGLPYFSGAGALGVLPKAVNGYTLVLAGGVPAWSAASSSAAYLAGGAANSLPYQNAPNSTVFLAAGSGVLEEVASGAPAWTLTPTLTGTNFSGVPLAALVTGGLPVAITVSTANVVPGFNGASNFVQMTAGGLYPAASGANITALTAANISAGTAGINISGNAATVTTNANLTGGVTSVGNAATVVTNANLTGEVTSVGNAATLTNSAVIGKVLTGYSSGAGTVAATDTILQAIQKLNGNDATNANLTGPVTSVGNATTIAGPLPAISGAPLTNLTAANISAGTAGIDISGNAATATKATNLAGGLVGKIPYQSALDTTLFLPAMGAGGLVTGNGTSAVPSTGTFTGTANQVVITRTGSNIVLSGPQDLGTGSSPSFVTVTANLTGTASLATLAASATNLAGGGAGQTPYQSAAGTTLFLPSMASMGIVLGNAVGSSASTITLQGTANQIVLTRAAATLTLSTPQDIQSGAAPVFAVTNFTGTGASMTAGAATNLAAGGAGQIPYQTGAGATAFLPAMAATGYIAGNGAAAPSTGTLTGTANQVIFTRTGANTVLSTPQSINSGATPTFTGTNFTAIPESGVTNLTSDLAAKAPIASPAFTGDVSGPSSATFNAFFGDGSHLTGISAGTTLMTTTCAVGGISASFTNTTFLVALTTVSATSTGKKIELTLNVSGCHTGAFSTLACGYLQDGAFTTGHSNTIGDSFLDQATGCSEEDMVGYTTVTQTAPSAALHYWALVCRVGAGTGTLNNAGKVMAQFCAKEVP